MQVFVFMNLDLQLNIDVSIYISPYAHMYNLQLLHSYVYTYDTRIYLSMYVFKVDVKQYAITRWTIQKVIDAHMLFNTIDVIIND